MPLWVVSVRGAAPRPLEVTEPGHRPSERRLHCVEVWSASPDSHRPSKHNVSGMPKGRIDVLRPSSLGVGHHCCGRVLSAAEPICGFGRVDADGSELWWGEAQNLGTPKHQHSSQ